MKKINKRGYIMKSRDYKRLTATVVADLRRRGSPDPIPATSWWACEIRATRRALRFTKGLRDSHQHAYDHAQQALSDAATQLGVLPELVKYWGGE